MWATLRAWTRPHARVRPSLVAEGVVLAGGAELARRASARGVALQPARLPSAATAMATRIAEFVDTFCLPR
jgi:hypothetical protein